ncbi:MAG: hypothetical protein R2910_13445 [Gemmatimonadales bacterium]
MWGPIEFTSTGTLKSYDATGRLGELRLPALITLGEFDEVRLSTAQPNQPPTEPRYLGYSASKER